MEVDFQTECPAVALSCFEQVLSHQLDSLLGGVKLHKDSLAMEFHGWISANKNDLLCLLGTY